jgi:hypothetical protein
MERVERGWRRLIRRGGVSTSRLWERVLDSVGKDPIATLAYLFFDNLASVVGRKADDYHDPGMIFSDIADESGEWDPDLEERAWRNAQREYAMRYRDKLGALSKEDLDEVLDLIDVLV